jgi:dihydropteroate synthase
MRPLVMGILNVTPDSFFDGGRYFSYERAVGHGLEMFEQGADIVDVGGESSRPGATPVSEAEELRRVLPVVEALAPRGRVSIDTIKPIVAAEAISKGATLINDISASDALAQLAAETGVGWVAMHMQGTPLTMQQNPTYHDVVGEVREFLVRRAEYARSLGVEEVWVDPGIGFGKTVAHNLALLASLPKLVEDGNPVLVGVSRKSFLGAVASPRPEEILPPEQRGEASLAAAAICMAAGARMVRVHDVEATVQAARLVGDQWE